MPIDPVGLDLQVESKQLDKPNRTATITASLWWNGVKKATFTMVLDAKDQSKAVDSFSVTTNVVPEP